MRIPRPGTSALQFAVLAAAAPRGGAEPDLPDEVAWWQTNDFWQYAYFAAVAYIRAAADRAGRCVRHATSWPSVLAHGPDDPGSCGPGPPTRNRTPVGPGGHATTGWPGRRMAARARAG